MPVILMDQKTLPQMTLHKNGKKTMVRNICCCFSPLVPSKRETNTLVLLSLYIFEGSVFTFQFLNDKIHNYVKKT